MGFYINPKNMSKEDWLRRNGMGVTQASASKHSAGDGGDFVVCLVDNGDFTAAGIAYNDGERDSFLFRDTGEQRPRQWFLVNRKFLKEFCSIL